MTLVSKSLKRKGLLAKIQFLKICRLSSKWRLASIRVAHKMYQDTFLTTISIVRSAQNITRFTQLKLVLSSLLKRKNSKWPELWQWAIRKDLLFSGRKLILLSRRRTPSSSKSNSPKKSLCMWRKKMWSQECRIKKLRDKLTKRRRPDRKLTTRGSTWRPLRTKNCKTSSRWVRVQKSSSRLLSSFKKPSQLKKCASLPWTSKSNR